MERLAGRQSRVPAGKRGYRRSAPRPSASWKWIPPVTRRTSHRSGYTPHDSAGGPAGGPGEPHHLLPSPGSAQAARHDATGGGGGPEAARR